MLNPEIILAGQKQPANPFETAAQGLQFGQALRQLLSGRQAGKMMQIENPEERKAYANNSMFSRELNAQIRADEQAKQKQLYDQLKTEAEISKISSEASKNNAQAGGYNLDNSGKLMANADRALMIGAQTGDPMAVKLALNNAYKAGGVTPELYDQYSKQIDILGTDPAALKQFASGLVFANAKDPASLMYTSADNRLDNETAVDNNVRDNETATSNNIRTNQTSEANNIRTTEASRYASDVSATTADKNRAFEDQKLRIQQQKGEVVTGADGKSYIFYPSIGKYEPMIDANGNHISKTGNTSEETQRINRVDAVLPEIEKLLPLATGSYAGSAADWLGRSIGVSTEGSKTTAQLKTLSGQLIALMPKMSGPQSDKDVAMYKEMAGNLSDSTLPIGDRMAALQTIRELNEKYRGLNTAGGYTSSSYKGSSVSLGDVKAAAQQAGVSTPEMINILKGQGISIK